MTIKFVDHDQVKEEIETLGLCAVSKMSAICYLAKLEIPLSAMLIFEKHMKLVESTMWALIPLCFKGEDEKIEMQLTQLRGHIDGFIAAASIMRVNNGE